MNPTFSGEVQLAGWSESHNGGCKVTFWLAESSDLDAFRAMTVRKGNTAGQRLACVLVEIGDDEQPVQAQEKPIEHEPAEPLGPLAMWAVQRCREGLFQRWLAEQYVKPVPDEKAAKAIILKACDIGSRRELDADPMLGEWFKRYVMERYGVWLQRQGVSA